MAAPPIKRRPKTIGRDKPNPDDRQRYNYFMELARSEVARGNSVAAENYYQYAEHYYRSMNGSS